MSADWLKDNINRDDLVVVDASWFLPAEGRSGGVEYLDGHIPGAVFFDIDLNSDHGQNLPHMLPSAEVFADLAGALGLSRDRTIVVYDSTGIRAAARVWWTLRVMGFVEVFVLDGGLGAWTRLGLSLQAGEAVSRPAKVTPQYRAQLVRGLSDVMSLVQSRDCQLVDARSGPRFRGEVPEPRAGLRSGHMPGALNVPFDQVLTPLGTLKSPDDLARVFADAGVKVTEPIVTTCGSGVTASVLALALAAMGHDQVAVYDGSWSEWGALADTPVVTGHG